MEGTGTEFALFGMILVGTALSLLGFWVEIHHRRREQREESRRQRMFVLNHATAHGREAAPRHSVATLDEAPEPAANGP